jgi:hypothetical protein
VTSGGTALQHAGQSFAVLLPRFDRRCWRARSDLFIVAALAGRGGVRKHVRGMYRHMLEHELEKPMARDCEKCRSERGASARTSARRTVVRVVRFPVGSFLSIDCAAAFDLLSISVRAVIVPSSVIRSTRTVDRDARLYRKLFSLAVGFKG